MLALCLTLMANTRATERATAPSAMQRRRRSAGRAASS